jgi:hypothetical protein
MFQSRTARGRQRVDSCKNCTNAFHYAPARGATFALPQRAVVVVVSITHPRGGATSRRARSRMLLFNPRTREGCDPLRPARGVVGRCLILAPARGATMEGRAKGLAPVSFQSTHRGGVRPDRRLGAGR